MSVPCTQDRSTKWLAKTFKTVIETLDVDLSKTVVVGHSMGAIVASEIEFPVLGTVLIGPVHPAPALAEVFGKRIEAVNNSMKQMMNAMTNTNEEHTDGLEFLADSIPDAATGSKSTPLQRAFIRALILSQKAENYNSLCRTIAQAEVPRYGVPGGGQSPLLIVAGSDDKTSPLTGCQTILDR